MRVICLVIAFFVMGLDQITKYFMAQKLAVVKTIHVIPGIEFTLSHNRGAAFSILANEPGWQRWLFIALAFIFSGIILIWLGRLSKRQKLEGFGLSLILGGAIGNVIDRLYYGHVIDFIVLYYKEWQWPAFNVADSAICIGVACLILNFLQKQPDA